MFLLLITSRIAIRLFSFNKILLFIKKLAFDGFYPLLVAIKLHQEKYNVNSVIPHNVLASDYLTDCHQALVY